MVDSGANTGKNKKKEEEFDFSATPTNYIDRFNTLIIRDHQTTKFTCDHSEAILKRQELGSYNFDSKQIPDVDHW